MESNMRREDEIEINLKDLFFWLWGKAVKIIGAGVVLAVIAVLATQFLMTPEYTSTTSMYVLNRQTAENITSSDLQSSTYLTRDYVQLIKSRTVVEAVIKELKLESTYKKMLNAMDVEALSDTRIISISVTNEDPALARDIADAIRTAAAEQIQRVMKTEAVNVVDEANLPTQPSSPSMKVNAVLACILGIFVMAVWYCVQFVMNDKITTADDVERYLGLGILGEMPLDEEEMKLRKRAKRSKKAAQKKRVKR